MIIFFMVQTCFSQQKFNFEFYCGLPLNIPMPLTINQNGERPLSLTARYASLPFNIPIFWIWRLSLYSENNGWEFEAVHHKMFLENKPSEVQQFDISHGLNLIFINRVWQTEEFIFRFGAGVAVAHPENEIRNKKLDEDKGILNLGYYISGPAINLSIGRHIDVTEFFYFSAETRINAAYAVVPIADGDSNVYCLSLQAVFGFGIKIAEL